MKICFLAAANSIHSVRWIKYFYEKGHEILWVSLAPSIPEAEVLIKKIHFYEIKPSPLSDINGPFAIRHLPLAVRQLKKILKTEKLDVMHIHSAGTYGLVGVLTGFHPAVLTPWGSDILIASSLKKSLIKFILGRIDLFTCDGKNTTEVLIKFGVKPEKIKMIRFGTDVEKFKPASKSKVQSAKFKVISLRSLEAIYDIETLIKAAAIVVKEFRNVEFLIAGDGSQKEYLMGLTENLKLKTENIKFLGRINNQDLPVLLQSADIYISTALSDSGLSASTAEAMATGLPVIVSDFGDNKKWVNPPAGGFVIPLKNPEALAEKIIYLIKNENERRKMGENNRKLIEQKNNYHKEMEKVEKIYEELTDSN